MSLPKWTDERTSKLLAFVGNESPVSQATVADAAESLETTNRSVASKLRKLGVEVESASTATAKAYSDEQEYALRALVEQNSGQFTYGELAAQFEDGAFSPKSIQGKVLSMELTDHIRPTPKTDAVRSFSESEEVEFISLAGKGKSLEDIATALGKTVNQVRGKALSLLRSEAIAAIPHQANKAAPKVDALEALGDVSKMTVAEIAQAIEKTDRGVKTMLTKRGIKVADYDGAARKEKAAS
jgi:DNA-binding transcriptional ArsR family regulator